MNPITFNDHLFQAINAFTKQQMPFEIYKPEGWKNVPLFAYETTQPKEDSLTKEARAHIMPEVFCHLPFPMIRLDFTCTAEQGKNQAFHIAYNSPTDTSPRRVEAWGRYHFRAVVLQQENDPAEIHAIISIDSLYKDEEGWTQRKLYPIWIMLLQVKFDERQGEYLFTPVIGVSGKWIKPADLFKTRTFQDGMIRTMCSGALNSICAFAYDCALPQTHVATVQPAEERKSVEWTKARTHYVLITHGHPANRKEVKPGERVANDQAGELTRMAHGRRAHWKTYRHERYRFARGQRRWIKATWVGPKEWRDEGGKQIYKLLEPVDSAA